MRRLVAVFAALLLSVAASRAHAQPSGVLAGSVRTSDGTPIPNLVLIVRGPGEVRTVVTGPEGRYRVTGLAPGHYRLDLRIPGFVLAGSPETDVSAAETALDLTLAPAPVRERVVVAATRDEAALSTVGVSATVLDSDRIAEREAPSVLALLEEVPGLAVARNGGIGLQGSVFVRGGESNFARILVDGVPVNEPGGEYNLGPLLPLELERVEVVRGAASSLYGTDALAGVIHFVTRRYPSAARWRAEGQGGSFGWWRGEAGSAGAAGRFDWNVGALDLRTDNEQPNSALRVDNVAASLGYAAGARTTLRLSLRGEDMEVGTPGADGAGPPRPRRPLRASDRSGGPAAPPCARPDQPRAACRVRAAGLALGQPPRFRVLRPAGRRPRRPLPLLRFPRPARLPAGHAGASRRDTSSRPSSAAAIS